MPSRLVGGGEGESPPHPLHMGVPSYCTSLVEKQYFKIVLDEALANALLVLGLHDWRLFTAMVMNPELV